MKIRKKTHTQHTCKITVALSPEADQKLREAQVKLRGELLRQGVNKVETTLGKLIEKVVLRSDFVELLKHEYTVNLSS